MKKINKIFSIKNVNRIKFREDINGLRAISVLAVVFYHIEIELSLTQHFLQLQTRSSNFRLDVLDIDHYI